MLELRHKEKRGLKNVHILRFVICALCYFRIFCNNIKGVNIMKTITVKGVGNVSVKPDLVVLSMSLESKNRDYETAMREAADKIEQINKSLSVIGFERESVKTTDFNVKTDYESKKDRAGSYYRVFNGYVVNHRLKMSFGFDTKLLSKALGTISGCIAEPELSISFTVKEPSAVNEALLRSATVNAKKKAEILCEASGAKLGELVNIDYNWGELNIYSRTSYDMGMDCMKMCTEAPYSLDIEPDDIDASDTVTFVWQIT